MKRWCDKCRHYIDEHHRKVDPEMTATVHELLAAVRGVNAKESE